MSDGRVVRLVRHDAGSPIDTSRWPATVPAVEQLLCEGLELPAGVTVLVGENGSGKSTMMEMLAEACGLNPQGGSGSLMDQRQARDLHERWSGSVQSQPSKLGLCP